MSLRLLILGGTTEGRQLAERLADDPAITLFVSLAGVTTDPSAHPGTVLTGGFGGAEGLAGFLARERIDLMIDATHPFAATMQAHAAEAAATAGIAAFRLGRPGFSPEPGDRWIPVATHEAAIAALGPVPRRVFLSIGRKAAPLYRAATGHAFVIRSIEPVEGIADWPGAVAILDRGPFDSDAETRLFAEHRIEVLVTKNSGGAATEAKLVAARRLELPVIIVGRPEAVGLDEVASVDAALDRIAAIRRSAGY